MKKKIITFVMIIAILGSLMVVFLKKNNSTRPLLSYISKTTSPENTQKMVTKLDSK